MGWQNLFGGGVTTSVIESIKRLEYKPGDVVLVKVPAGARPEYVEQLRQRLSDMVPGMKFVVHSEGVDVSVIRPESDPDILA